MGQGTVFGDVEGSLLEVEFMDYQMEELLPVVSALAQKYAGCESTSVTYEKAQSLMEAVLFCLNEYDNSFADSLVQRHISVREQYEKGAELLAEKVEDIRKTFNEISLQFDDFGVRCLYDTVQKGIPHFLRWYDIKFCPQNTILTLDYPLLADYGSLTGADAVYQYVRAIRTEQIFLGRFDRNYVRQVLERYNPEYRDMIENVCGIVLTNMIGHMMLRKPLNEMGFTDEEYLRLSEEFAGKSISDIESAVKELIGKLVSQFYGYDTDMDMLAYLCHEANNIAARIYTADQYGRLNRVFVL